MRTPIRTLGIFCITALLAGIFGVASGHAAQTGHTPAQVVDAYVAAMKRHDASPDLDIYTQATKTMLGKWRVNNAQMDNLVIAQSKCPSGQTIIDRAETHAVLRYPVTERRCNPYFLMMEDGDWRLDLTMMQLGIQFNRRNEWHFIPGQDHPYWFAFEDWRLDEHGFPYPAW